MLERVVRDAPCSAIRAVAHGMRRLPAKEQLRAIEGLVLRVVTKPGTEAPASGQPSSRVEAFDRQLLERAMASTGFDEAFLASRAEGSIASLAWAHASAPVPPEEDANLATALTMAPIRRWLAVHLLARFSTLLR